jgi:hypothetical protein
MATINLAGRAFELAPYRLGAIRKAAAYLDRINARGVSIDTLEVVLESAHEMCEVLAIGLSKIDPEYTAEWLEDQLGIEDMPALQTAFKEVLVASGLAQKGEAQPLSAPAEGEGTISEDSASKSAELSPS